MHYLPIDLMEVALDVNWKGDQISGMFATIMFRTFLIYRLCHQEVRQSSETRDAPGHVALKGDVRNSYQTLVGKREGRGV